MRRAIKNEEIQGARFFCGLDFGYVNDPSALVWGFYAPDKRRVMVTGEFVGRTCSTIGLRPSSAGRGLPRK